MEANVIVQTALLAVLPLVMQGLKKMPFVETNKAWLCPLLCIAAATGTAYFMKLPDWLLVGVITGAACNKIYDWTKDAGAAIAPAILLCLVVLAGCSPDNFLGVCRTSTAGLVVKRVAVPFIGCDKAMANVAIVRALETCIDGWHQNVIDGNEPAGDFVACAVYNSSLLKAEIAKCSSATESGIGLKMQIVENESVRLFKATPEEIETAYRNFKNACAAFYIEVDYLCLTASPE